MKSVCRNSILLTAITREKNINTKIQVKKVIDVTGISLDYTELTMHVGGTVRLNPTVTPSNATNKDVRWLEGAMGTVSIDTYGRVTALKPGTANISAIAWNKTADSVDDKTVNCKITVLGHTYGEPTWEWSDLTSLCRLIDLLCVR